MKIDSVPSPSRPAKRPPIWVCVLINQLAFPGLGTVMAGRRMGYPQAVIMVVGFVLVMAYLLWYLSIIVRYMQNGSWTEAEFHSKYRPYLWALYDGLGLCLVAWVWALFSSVALWRERNGSAADTRGAKVAEDSIGPK